LRAPAQGPGRRRGVRRTQPVRTRGRRGRGDRILGDRARALDPGRGRGVSGDLEQRLVELETRLAFQEQALSELNEALTSTRLEAAAHAELLKRVLQDLKLVRGDGPGDPALEPPPPHY